MLVILMGALSLLIIVDTTVKKGNDIMITKTFEKPTQIKVLIIGETDSETDITEFKTCGAIAYKDMIICGCCGQVFHCNNSNIYLVSEYKSWMDINEEITG